MLFRTRCLLWLPGRFSAGCLAAGKRGSSAFSSLFFALCLLFSLFFGYFCFVIVVIRAVRISRRFQPEELHDLKVCWLRTIENGGVLVSPFISVAEKRVRDYAIANDGRLILIEQNGFGPRYKPSGQYFGLCAEGRLLMVAPVEYSTSKIVLSREWCLRHNELAGQIEAGNWRLA